MSIMHGTIKIQISTMTVTSSIVTDHKNANFTKNGIMQMSFPISDQEKFNALYKVGVTTEELTSREYKINALRATPKLSEEAKSIAEKLS